MACPVNHPLFHALVFFIGLLVVLARYVRAEEDYHLLRHSYYENRDVLLPQLFLSPTRYTCHSDRGSDVSSIEEEEEGEGGRNSFFTQEEIAWFLPGSQGITAAVTWASVLLLFFFLVTTKGYGSTLEGTARTAKDIREQLCGRRRYRTR